MHNPSDWKGAECYEEKNDANGKGAGADYRGVVAETVEGNACLSWAAKTKNDGAPGSTWPGKTRNGVGNHTFCRNPDREPSPWCYTVKKGIANKGRWALCDVGAAQVPGFCKGTSVHACVMHACACFDHDELGRGELPTRLGVFRGSSHFGRCWAWGAVGTGHTVISCEVDPKTCTPGQHYKHVAISRGQCAACDDGQYQDASGHQKESCKEQKKCDAGQYLDGADATKDGTCKACADGTFQGEDGVRTACQPHTKCKAGQFLQGNTATSAGSCAACTDNTYQDETGHSKAACKGNTVTTCDKGAALDKPKEPTRATKCTTCAAGHYQQNDDSTDQCTQQVRATTQRPRTRHDRAPAQTADPPPCPLFLGRIACTYTCSYKHTCPVEWSLVVEQPTQGLACMCQRVARQGVSAAPLTITRRCMRLCA